MRTLSITALIALVSMAGLTHAQGYPEPRPLHRPVNEVQQKEIQRLVNETRERQREARTTCMLPDGSSYPLKTVARYEGQRYRCVEVFTPSMPVPAGESQTLAVRLAGWIKI